MKEQIQKLIDTFIPNQRKVDFRNLAHQHGFSFKSRASLDEQDFGIRGFKIIKSKYWNEFKGIITKQVPSHGSTIRVYDYVSSDNYGNHTTTIIEIKCTNLDISKFKISPIPKIRKIKTLLIGHENEFFTNYKLESDYIDSIYRELGEDTLYLINTMRKISIEGDGSYIVLYYKHKKIKIYDIMKHYNIALDLLDKMLTSDRNYDFV